MPELLRMEGTPAWHLGPCFRNESQWLAELGLPRPTSALNWLARACWRCGAGELGPRKSRKEQAKKSRRRSFALALMAAMVPLRFSTQRGPNFYPFFALRVWRDSVLAEQSLEGTEKSSVAATGRARHLAKKRQVESLAPHLDSRQFRTTSEHLASRGAFRPYLSIAKARELFKRVPVRERKAEGKTAGENASAPLVARPPNRVGRKEKV